MRKLVLILLCAVAVFALGGCGPAERTDTVRYVLEAEPASLDPAMTTALPENIVELQLFEGLTRLDDQDVPQPALAERWDVSADGLTYTFYLRPGLHWSDGVPLTASDFEYAWKRALDPDVASENAYMMFPLVNGEAYFNRQVDAAAVGVHAVDDRTLIVKLAAPTAYFLSLTAFHSYYAVPRHVVEKAPQTWASGNMPIVGSGPYTISKWIHASEIDFVKNETYWDAASVTLPQLEFPISDSQATRLTLVESGQADMMVEPPPADETRLEEAGLYHVAPYLGSYYYVFNVTAKPFDDVRVRKAFALAVRRRALIANVVRSRKQPAYAWVPPGLVDPATGVDFRTAGGTVLQPEDAAAAKALLQQAGYDDGSKLPDIRILFNTSEMHKAIAEALQAMWHDELGVTVGLVNQEAKVFMASRSSGDFQIARASWVADYADPMTFLSVFADAENDAQYHNERYTELIHAAQQTNDAVLRMKLMHEAENILFDDCVIIPIYYTTQPFVAQPYVKGYHWSSLGLVDFKRAYIEK